MQADSQTIVQLSEELGELSSEATNAASVGLDRMSALDIARLMNDEDKLVAKAVEAEIGKIGQAIDLAADALSQGGRIIYIGAGTSGRLGVLDASECPPTFGVPDDWVIGIIAGGPDAMFVAQEGAEDQTEAGVADIDAFGVTEKDLVVGLAVSGRTPYVLGAVERARVLGARTIGVTSNADSPLERTVDICVITQVGPEVLSGSTRLKSGTAQKMVLNMISTGAMVRTGKCYGNRMIDLKVSNEKLMARALRLVRDITSADAATILSALRDANWRVKTAIVTLKKGCGSDEANRLLNENGGHLWRVIGN